MAILKKSFIEAAGLYPDMAFDFAFAVYMIDERQASLAILETIELTLQERWFYLEVKIKCRHFLEVLTELNQTLPTVQVTFKSEADVKKQLQQAQPQAQ